jgi:hypothetical protein
MNGTGLAQWVIGAVIVVGNADRAECTPGDPRRRVRALVSMSSSRASVDMTVARSSHFF